MIKEIHIFDFDGTLVDSSHRYQTKMVNNEEKIDLEFWIDNENKTAEDSILPMINIFNAICEDSTKYALIATARIWCKLSEKFASDHNIKPDGLVARQGHDDSRGGAQLKISHVKRLLNLKQFRGVEQIHIYEDNYSYLTTIMKSLDAIGHYIPSKQGH